MKRKLSALNENDLRKLLSALCSANKENALLVDLYMNDNSVIESFRKKIDKSLNPDDFSFREVKHYLSVVKKFCNDLYLVAELHVYATEVGNDITMEYGDIDENYYNAMENLFEASCKLVTAMDAGEERDELQERLNEIVDDTDGIGWGYHDGLCDIYGTFFPMKEDGIE